MLRVARRVNTDIQFQVALGLPCAEGQEQVMYCRNNNAVVRYFVIGPMVYIIIHTSGSSTLGTIILPKFQREPDVFDESSVTASHRTKVGDAP
jgi:hypothetical protein